MLNKGADSQRISGTRQNMYCLNSALLYQSRGLFFVFVIGYKGYNCTKHNDKGKDIRPCYH